MHVCSCLCRVSAELDRTEMQASHINSEGHETWSTEGLLTAAWSAHDGMRCLLCIIHDMQATSVPSLFAAFMCLVIAPRQRPELTGEEGVALELWHATLPRACSAHIDINCMLL